MLKKSSSLKYMLLTYRLDMLWLPAAFLGLFIVLAWMLKGEPAGFPVTTAFLGAALPLLSGILSAYAVLDDPALELQFATPRPAWRMLLERLGMIFLLAAACAFSYQGVLALLGVDLAVLGGLAARQLAWIAPTLAAIAVGAVVSFAARQSITGAAVIGIVWIVEIIMRDWFLGNRWGQYFLLIMGSNYPEHPALRANQAVLIVTGTLLAAAAWALLNRQERYI